MAAKSPSVETVFAEAIDIASADERSRFLDRICDGNRPLRVQVESLLDAHHRAGGFLAEPAPTLDVPGTTCERPGEVIGPYKLLEEIGEGGMGVVYLAEQSEPVRRRVALKVIRPGMDTRQVVARFEAERQALALMDHPNIARVLDCGTAPSGRPYFVMELVRGLPITEYCDREKMSIRDRLDLFIQVCRAVQHAHQKGIIHRDLKPSNVLVTLIDGRPVPKVIDFGIAKATSGVLTDKTLFTGFHQFIGTPLYTSPEQAELSGVDVDTRSDIYSLGVLLYELLTGTTPFDASTLKNAPFDEMRRIIREDDPPRPSTRLSTLGETLSTVSARRQADPKRLGSSLRGELDWIVMKALEKDRRRRYETANDFTADVENFLADRQVNARPTSASYRFVKFVRRNRTILVPSTLILSALLLGIGLTTWQAIKAMAAEKKAKVERDRADERSELARRAVDDMYTQVAEKWLSDQPSLTAVQRQFLEKAAAFYERFGQEPDTDPRLGDEGVRALIRVGEIRNKLGDRRPAEAAWRRAIDKATELAAKAPARPETQLALAEARISLCNILRETGRSTDPDAGIALKLRTRGGDFSAKGPGGHPAGMSESDLALREARRGLAGIHVDSISDKDLLRRLAIAHARLGGELTIVRQLPEAGAAVDTALSIWMGLNRENPGDFPNRLGLARAYQARGMQAMWWGDENAKAMESLRQAETLLSALLEERPADPGVRTSLAGALINLGVLQSRSRHFAHSEAINRRVIPLLETLVREFPEIVEHQNSLADTLHNLAVDLVDQSRDADAEPYIRRALVINEQLADGNPDATQFRAKPLGSLEFLATYLWRIGQFMEARKLLERGIQRAQPILNSSAGDRTADVRLSNMRLRVAMVCFELGDRDAAESHLAEWSRSMLGPLPIEGLGSGVALIGEGQIQAVENASGNANFPAARRMTIANFYRIAFKSIVREAERRGADDRTTCFCLADLLTTAPVLMRDGNAALRHARRALKIKPDDAMAWQSLGWALYRQGDWAGCIKALREHSTSSDQDFFVAMSLWQLGEKEDARVTFDRASEWLTLYEEHWEDTRRKRKSPSLPLLSLYLRVEAEAAALIGVKSPLRQRAEAPPAAKGPAERPR